MDFGDRYFAGSLGDRVCAAGPYSSKVRGHGNDAGMQRLSRKPEETIWNQAACISV